MIDQNITGNTPSTTTNATKDVSDVIVDKTNGNGKVSLQIKSSNTQWITISEQSGSFSVITPDTNLSYRFLPENVTGTIRVYFGE